MSLFSSLAGFHFTETMRGTWHPADAGGPERAIEFSVTARARSLRRHLRDKQTSLDGTITVEGLTGQVPVRGRMHIDPLFARVIRYELDFTADNGNSYALRGQKDVRFLELPRTMTTLPAELFDAAERVIGTATLKFDERDLPRFLASFRPGAGQ